ncbi:uncharacterized protein N7459_001552 [Penicillium hispanicum]|uniref:uncharacterized protein n=1 Tax=Penicillium hispanicum TaxID=1080232 RepID=UPI00253FA7DC|nr:uncharacterized protein N7459_001552 [Penicillium hispanicum]KAJ5595344.1 hypothetical protein N7459_001552 [Penicillium hispanicum]
MPVPTADVYDKQTASQSSATNTHTTASSGHVSTEPHASDRAGSSSTSAVGASQHGTEGDRALSKEEADRLYEERMEEEYAKREGGA